MIGPFDTVALPFSVTVQALSISLPQRGQIRLSGLLRLRVAVSFRKRLSLCTEVCAEILYFHQYREGMIPPARLQRKRKKGVTARCAELRHILTARNRKRNIPPLRIPRKISFVTI